MAFVEGRLPQWLKLVHGSGAVAFGIKDGGFSFFLLPYYNLVLGMDAGLVSLALALALLVDATIDPLIGHLSDRTYTRWGRRLPWLYVAPIPLAIMWVILWSPPMSGTPSFWGLVAIAVGVRLLLSACEVPSVSLVPEITEGYDERTTLFRYRFLFGWIGGLMMMVMAFFVFLPTPEAQLRQEGYQLYGMFGAAMMVLFVIGSAAAQHRVVAHLPPHRPGPFSLPGAFSEICDAFSERAFLIFAAGGLAAYIGQGMSFSITQYVNLYVWQFDGTAFRLYPAVLFLSVVLMFVIVGPLHARLGKPGTAWRGAIVSVIAYFAPYTLFLAGVWPQPGTALSTGLVYLSYLVANTASVVSIISATSMVAEIVEAFEERTGKRAEGTFYSGNWLVQKFATGGGILLTGFIIQTAGLEPGSPQGAVPEPVIDTLVLLYMGAAALLAAVAAYWLARFPITREEHEQRIADRAARVVGEAARAEPGVPPFGGA